MFRKEANESNLNLQDLRRICSEHVLPVTSPLALIAQIKGSGGSLLSQLFDGHPELHAHSHELSIGYPEEHIWPRIDLSEDSKRWFEVLFEDIVCEYNREGYKQDKEDKETFPFIIIPALQREIFLKYLDSVQFITLRDIFDAYMTSYFGAWLSNQNYYGPKKFVTAHTMRLATAKENMEFFFEVYPDGRLIYLIREPKNWYASAQKSWPDSYTDVGRAAGEWNESIQAMLWSKEKYGDCVCLLKFEDLVGKTEAVMRYLAEFLGIEFNNILLAPTFNKFPIRANASLNAEDHGVVNSPLFRERTLTGQELNTIEEISSETYRLVLNEVVRF
jgi:hypothetical protein